MKLSFGKQEISSFPTPSFFFFRLPPISVSRLSLAVLSFTYGVRDKVESNRAKQEEWFIIMLNGTTPCILTCIRCTILLWIAIHPVLCFGQVSSSASSDRDSLYRHISREYRAELTCRFTYPQGSAVIQSYLGDNASELDKLDAFIQSVLRYSDLSIDRIRLSGYSSIEGTYAINERLAFDRVESFRDYLSIRYPDLYRYPVDVSWVAEDWDGLARLVRASDLRDKHDIFNIIHSHRSSETRKSLLATLNNGRTYQEIEYTLLPLLRRVEIEIEYTTASPQPSPREKELGTQGSEQGEIGDDPLIYSVLDRKTPVYDYESTLYWANIRRKRASYRIPSARSYSYVYPRWAVKTNLPSWAGVRMLPDITHTTFIPNLAVEYYITLHWSLEAGAMYSYWNFNDNLEFQGISGYRLEPRYRYSFSGSQRSGVYLGLYGRFGDYDFCDPEDNYTGDYWDAGLSGGIYFPIVDKLGLEMGVRVGYVHTNAIRYMYEGGKNRFDSREKYNKVKVTDLNLSLIYRLR